MNSHENTICALGDFNTIPGQIETDIRNVIPENMNFMVSNTFTFFGSFFDTVRSTEDENWQLLL